MRKKLLSFVLAIAIAITSMSSLAITASAVSAITDFTYKLEFTTVPTANDTADIKDASNNTVMTVTYLGGTWKQVGTGIAPNDKADRPTKSPYDAGCAIQFVPASNGEVLVDR
ncbi:MAG: hypothetical protein IJR33_05170, partial [Clostridia bacterium]|nr:hypothetical protein [Clostridia bacterium]